MVRSKRQRKDDRSRQGLVAQRPGWKFVDHFSSGDCACRCIAHSLSHAQGKTLEGESLVREASQLRVLAIGQLIKHADQ